MKSRKNRWSLALRYILLLLGGAVSVMPMIYMLSTSLRPNGALYEFPPHFFPKLSEITLENYRYIFAQEKFYLNFINSVIVAVITIVLAAIIASALAYCLARFEFPGKKLLFALVIGMMIIPGTTLIIPQFQLASFFGITNSLAGLIPFYVAWVIPSVSIFNFLTAWEEFTWAMTVINDNAKRTLPIAISGFFGQHQFTQWGYVFAMSVASLVPVLIMFILCQKYFVSGLQAGGLKG